MPIRATKKIIKQELIEVDSYFASTIVIRKPSNPTEEDPIRLRVEFECHDNNIDTGERVDLTLEGQDAIDFIGSHTALEVQLKSAIKDFGILNNVFDNTATVE